MSSKRRFRVVTSASLIKATNFSGVMAANKVSNRGSGNVETEDKWSRMEWSMERKLKTRSSFHRNAKARINAYRCEEIPRHPEGLRTILSNLPGQGLESGVST